MRVAAIVLFLAIASLTASSLAWLAATGGSGEPPPIADGSGALAELERTQRPSANVDVAARYAGRLDLLDPRLALPTWHKHARDEAARVYMATRRCPPSPLEGTVDAALAKAWSWHAATCRGGAPLDALVDAPPFMHPSGRSYAALAHAAGGAPRPRSFHVLELASLDASVLDPDERALAALGPHAWEALTRGDRVVLTPSSLVVADHALLGIARLRVYPRGEWEAFAQRARLTLGPRAPSTLCARPASTELCWGAVSVAQSRRPWLLAWTTSSAALTLLSALALGVAYVRMRRRVYADRIHVLRTLTHELRTPATSLRLDIEPLRAAYDELPARCQEPLLRISDDVERLHRVLHRTARYMALFEAGAPAERLVAKSDVPSVRGMFEELSEEWPDGVSLSGTTADGAIYTDRDWLGVAVRNLVENAARHGRAPISVTWALERDGDSLVVRVADRGETRALSLERVVTPWARDAKSEGLGLGLAIVARVARLLGGRLSHEPSPTVFELFVPTRRTRERQRAS